jgi:deoxyadenosine/deoxycytidine kinase
MDALISDEISLGCANIANEKTPTPADIRPNTISGFTAEVRKEDRVISEIANTFKNYTESNTFSKSTNEHKEWMKLRGCIIALEGIIGAGKTTAGAALVRKLTDAGMEAFFVEERVCDTSLKLFYEDPTKYSFAIQMDMLRQCQMAYIIAKQRARAGAIVFVDRTVWGNGVFAAMHHAAGTISEKEFAAYRDAMASMAPYAYDYVLYLDIDPKSAIERVVKYRAREAEKTMKVDYLLELEKAYCIHLTTQIRAKHTRAVVMENERVCNPGDMLKKLLSNEIRSCEDLDLSRLSDPSYVREFMSGLTMAFGN